MHPISVGETRLLDEARKSRLVLETADKVLAVSRALFAGELILLDTRRSSRSPQTNTNDPLTDAWRELRRPIRNRARQPAARRRYPEAA